MDITLAATILALGTLLAASCGLRAFVAPFVMACAGGLGWLDLGPQLSWLASPLAIGTLAVAIILEILADKIPLVDHGMDVIHVVVKPATGALAAAALLDGNDPMLTWVAAILGGGALAGATHLTKASVRVGSTTTTAGLGNVVLSIIEDVVVMVVSGGAVAGISLLSA